MSQPVCAACGAPSDKRYSIQRDYYEEGPEVWLCDSCGGGPGTMWDLWRDIRHRYLEGFPMDYVFESDKKS